MSQPASLPVKGLQFDKHNPRLVEFGIGSSTPEEDILKTVLVIRYRQPE